MILMVSVQDLYEAKQALKGGADIVDVKNCLLYTSDAADE